MEKIIGIIYQSGFIIIYFSFLFFYMKTCLETSSSKQLSSRGMYHLKSILKIFIFRDDMILGPNNQAASSEGHQG